MLKKVEMTETENGNPLHEVLTFSDCKVTTK